MRTARAGIERGFERLSDRLGLRQVPVTILVPGGQSQSITLTDDANVLITLWGGGSAGSPSTGDGKGGHSGAVCRRRLQLSKGATIDITAGRGQCRSTYPQISTSGARSAAATTATIVDSSLGTINMSAGPGQGWVSGVTPVAAVASGGDLNLAGLLATGVNGAATPTGSDADGTIPVSLGGKGLNTSQGSSTYKGENGFSPGAGGGCMVVAGATLSEPGDGGEGQAILTYTVTR